jgi:hypothetical protein
MTSVPEGMIVIAFEKDAAPLSSITSIRAPA